MNIADRNCASLLRCVAVAVPLALAGLAPLSAGAEPRPTPVPHNGSLATLMAQHGATDPAPARVARGTDPVQPGAAARDPEPGNSSCGTQARKVSDTASANPSADWHSWEWRIDGGPGE